MNSDVSLSRPLCRGLMVLVVLGTSIAIVTASGSTRAEAAVSSSQHSHPNLGVSGVTYLCGPTTGYSCTPGYTGTNASGWAWSDYGCPSYASGCPGSPHNCTLYAAFRLMGNGYGNPGWSANATNWASDASAHGVAVDQSPVVGSIAQWNLGVGHVAYVEQVNKTNIVISMDDYYTSNPWPVGYTASVQINNGSPAWPDNFIHFKDQEGGSSGPPPTPTGLAATSPASSEVSLNWTEPSGGTPTESYYVYRNGALVGNSTTPSFKDGGLGTDSEYNYTVSALDASGSQSPQSASVQIKTLSSQVGVAWISRGNTLEYCRRVGGVNNVTSYLSCTSFNGTTFGPTVSSGVQDWGTDSGKAWVMLGKHLDYCRRVGGPNNVNSFVSCTSFNGTTFGKTVSSPQLDWGFDSGAAWIPMGTSLEYCRRVGGVNNVNSYLSCTSFNGTTFGPTVSSGVEDWGTESGRAWVKLGNQLEYCRRVGGPNNVYSFVSCTSFNGTSFGPTVSSPQLDWGTDAGVAWVKLGNQLEYCRRVGGPNNVNSFVSCTPFNGTSFGATGSSGVLDWGFDS